MVTRETSNKITVLSFLAALLVVFIHSSNSLDRTTFEGRVWLSVFQDGVCGFAVPFFFVVSGFFLVQRFDGTFSWYRNSVVKRIFSLLIPYVIWNVAYIVLVKGLNVNPLRDFGIVTVTPCNSPLWYIKVLFLFVCVSLPMARAMKGLSHHKGGGGWVFVLGAILLGLPFAGVKTFFRAAYYMSFGMWLAFGGAEFILSCGRLNRSRMCSILFAVWTVAVGTQYFFRWPRFWLYIPIATIPIIWWTYDWVFDRLVWLRRLSERQWFLDLCRTSFFVYCIHNIVIVLFGRSIGADGVGGVIILALTGFAFSLAFAVLLRRFLPQVYRFLMGGRG